MVQSFRPSSPAGTAAISGLLLAAALATTPAPAHAQPLLSAEVTVPYTYPLSSFREQDTQGVIGFGARALVRIFPAVQIYGGWDRATFDCPSCTGGSEIRATGPSGGIEAQLFTDASVRPWFRVGAVKREVTTDAPLSEIEDPDVWGIQIAVGLVYNLFDPVSLTAATRLETSDPSIDLGNDLTVLGTPVSYLAFEFGLRLHTPG